MGFNAGDSKREIVFGILLGDDITVFGRGKEIVRWAQEDWVKNPSLVPSIVGLVVNYSYMPIDEFAAIFGKHWDSELQEWVFNE